MRHFPPFALLQCDFSGLDVRVAIAENRQRQGSSNADTDCAERACSVMRRQREVFEGFRVRILC